MVRSIVPEGIFPVGTHVYREPHQDQEELIADLPILKKLGFNMVKIQECWNIDEPREGEIDLSRIERVIARAREVGLGVYVGLTMEQAPMWFWLKHPDAAIVRPDGSVHNTRTQYCLPSDGKPGFCWDHAEGRADAMRFIRTLAARLGRFDNLWVWNTYQEIMHPGGDNGPTGHCYCGNTLALFRSWLREKYDSVGTLNEIWQTGYGSWEEVDAPRGKYPSNPPSIDWRYFVNDVWMSRNLAYKTQALKEGDPKKRPVFSHLAMPLIGRTAEWRWAAQGDFFGTSYYPAWSPINSWDDTAMQKSERVPVLASETWLCVQMRTDYVRSSCAGLPAWAAEFQGGPVSTQLHKGRTPDAADIRRWMLSGLSSGLNGINFWNHRPEIAWGECNGFGLLDHTGDTTERAAEAGRIAQAINEDPDVLVNGETAPAEVAILLNEDLYHFCQCTGNDAGQHLSFGIIGHYYRMWSMGVGVDFVSEEQVAQGALARYKAAILPVPVALDPAYFTHLRAYVEQGGFLISDACPGRFDRIGFCPRAQMVAGAEEVFGCRHRDVRIIREPEGERQRWTPYERGWGEFDQPALFEGSGVCSGAKLRPSFYCQTLKPTTAEAILVRGDDVVGTLNAFGRGHAALIGTFAGHGSLAHRQPNDETLFRALLDKAGVVCERFGALLRRRRVLGDREAWFFTNPTDSEEEATINLMGKKFRRDLVGNGGCGVRDGKLSVTVGPLDVVCALVG